MSFCLKKILSCPSNLLIPPKTPDSKPRALNSTSPLSDKAKILLLSKIQTQTETNWEAKQSDCMSYIADLISKKEFSGLPDTLKFQLKTLADFQHMASSVAPSLKNEANKALSTFLSTEVPTNFKTWLSLEGWASDKLLTLAQHLDIEIPHNNFIQCKIKLGKVKWRVYVSELDAWFAPETGSGSKQKLKQIDPPLDQSNGSFVNMTLQDFVVFKNAGKRNRPDKNTLASQKLLFTRVGRDKDARKIPPALFDVGRYSTLTPKEYAGKYSGLNMDHIPQDKWLLKAYYDYPQVELVQKTLMNAASRQIDADNFKTMAKKNMKLLTSNRMKDMFPVLKQAGFQGSLNYINSIGNLTADRRNVLTTHISSFAPYVSHSSLTQVLDNYEKDVNASGLAIAVPENMHNLSRTFGLKGRVTQERLAQNNSVLTETLLDHRHYQNTVFRQIFQKQFDEDLVAIGAFRYHYRQIVKIFNISQEEVKQSGYDQELTNYLRRWVDHHQTGKK